MPDASGELRRASESPSGCGQAAQCEVTAQIEQPEKIDVSDDVLQFGVHMQILHELMHQSTGRFT
jgi:hypothetical protein